ncbi:MAG: hypothetical protein RL177_413, partial [Bacteroidota bacterium]
SIVQQEAGDAAEIIWGTVLDESFGDELRVTVIATGFELSESGVKPNATATQPPVIRAPFAQPVTMPRTPALGQLGRKIGGTDPWRGESNLKAMDSPAIHRRPINITAIKPAKIEEPVVESGTEQASPFSMSNERISKGNPEQPAFLRKIMD